MGELWRGERKGGVEIQMQRQRGHPFLRNPSVLAGSTHDRRLSAPDLSAQDVCDTHLVVVDDRREMVGREEIRFEQDGIGGEGRVGVTQAAKYQVGLWSSSARWENRILERKRKTGGSR